MDGCFRRELAGGSVIHGEAEEEFSLYTMHLYLNDSDGTDGDGKGALVGGATSFFSPSSWGRQPEGEVEVKVRPKTGRVLIFQQAHLLHSGEEVLAGLKLTMRTDIMYKRSSV